MDEIVTEALDLKDPSEMVSAVFISTTEHVTRIKRLLTIGPGDP